MKNILSLFVILGVLLGMSGFVMADSQTVNGNVATVVSASLTTPSVSYGAITPGTDSAPQNNTIHIDDANNVNLNVAIAFTSGDTLFHNIFFDISGDGIYQNPSEMLDAVTLNWPVTDIASTGTGFNAGINSILTVPSGYPAIASASAVLTYTFTAVP